MPFVLGAVLIYTLLRRNSARTHAAFQASVEAVGGLGDRRGVGFYDGFLGPRHRQLLRLCVCPPCSASTSCMRVRVPSCSTPRPTPRRARAVRVEGPCLVASGRVDRCGQRRRQDLAGTRMALKHGAGFVRGVFIVVVALLIARDCFQAPSFAAVPLRPGQRSEQAPVFQRARRGSRRRLWFGRSGHARAASPYDLPRLSRAATVSPAAHDRLPCAVAAHLLPRAERQPRHRGAARQAAAPDGHGTTERRRLDAGSPEAYAFTRSTSSAPPRRYGKVGGFHTWPRWSSA